MFLYLKIAGGFEQKSSRLIEAHVHKVYCNIKYDFFNFLKDIQEKRANYVCTLLYCGTLLNTLCTLLVFSITLHFQGRGGGAPLPSRKISPQKKYQKMYS